MTTRNAIPSEIHIGTADRDLIEAISQSETVINLSGWKKLATVNVLLHMPDAECSLIFPSGLCDNDHDRVLVDSEHTLEKQKLCTCSWAACKRNLFGQNTASKQYTKWRLSVSLRTDGSHGTQS